MLLFVRLSSWSQNITQLYWQSRLLESSKFTGIVLRSKNAHECMHVCLYLTCDKNVQWCSMLYRHRIVRQHFRCFSSPSPSFNLLFPTATQAFFTTQRSVVRPRLRLANRRAAQITQMWHMYSHCVDFFMIFLEDPEIMTVLTAKATSTTGLGSRHGCVSTNTSSNALVSRAN